MSRRLRRLTISLFACAMAWLVAGQLAAAKKAEKTPLNFSIQEDEGGVTVQVRGLRAEEADRSVITSKTGYLLFFDGYKASATRLRPKDKHRLAFAQIGQTKDRVAMRLTQNRRSKGALSGFVESTAVDGGIDFRITDDTAAVPADETNEQTDPGDEATLDSTERAATLAALQASLEDELEPSPVPPDPDAAVADTPQNEASPSVDELAEPEEEVPAQSQTGAFLEASEDSEGPPIVRGTIAFIGLIAAGAAALWWTKHRGRNAADAGLTVVSRVGVGPKQAVVWVRAGSRELLLGATERRIEVLAELGPAGAAPANASLAASAAVGAPEPTAPSPAAPARIAAFKAKLERALGDELSRTPPHEDEDDGTPPHLRVLTEDPRWATGAEDVA